MAIDQTNYYFFENAFSEEEIGWIENLQNLYEYSDAVTLGNGLNEEVRKSRIKWIHDNEYSNWLYCKILSMVHEANNELWDFKIDGIKDSIQYTEYNGDGGHYDWHMDIGPGSISHRKISVVIQLTEPDHYKGGELLLWNGGEPKVIKKGIGNVVVFPSFLMHKVNPTFDGTRKSLVLWAGNNHYE